MNSYIDFILFVLSGLLKIVIKDPKSYAHLKSILTEIAADIATILASL